MSRPLRINLPNLIYHVCNRGNNRQILFAEDQDYQHYLEIVRRYKEKFGFSIFAYCLMINHVHILIKTAEKGSISTIMKAMTIAHTHYYHKNYQASGHVWQGRFRSPIVSDDAYLLNVMRYIEQNPVRAGIVAHPAEYAISSYRANVTIQQGGLVDKEKNPVFLRFGGTAEERAQRYKDFADRALDEEKLNDVRTTLNGKSNYVSEKFQAQIDQMLKEKRKRGRGRPRKIINPEPIVVA